MLHQLTRALRARIFLAQYTCSSKLIYRRREPSCQLILRALSNTTPAPSSAPKIHELPNILLNAINSNNLSLAMATAQSLVQGSPSPPTDLLSRLLFQLYRHDRDRAAEVLIRTLADNPTTSARLPAFLPTLIEALLRHGRVQGALALFNICSRRAILLDLPSVNHLLASLGRLQASPNRRSATENWTHVFEPLGKSMRRARRRQAAKYRQDEDIRRTRRPETGNGSARALIEPIMRYMSRVGLQPTAVTYSCAIWTAIRCGDWSTVSRAIETSEAVEQELPSETWFVIYAATIRAQRLGGHGSRERIRLQDLNKHALWHLLEAFEGLVRDAAAHADAIVDEGRRMAEEEEEDHGEEENRMDDEEGEEGEEEEEEEEEDGRTDWEEEDGKQGGEQSEEDVSPHDSFLVGELEVDSEDVAEALAGDLEQRRRIAEKVADSVAAHSSSVDGHGRQRWIRGRGFGRRSNRSWLMEKDQEDRDQEGWKRLQRALKKVKSPTSDLTVGARDYALRAKRRSIAESESEDEEEAESTSSEEEYEGNGRRKWVTATALIKNVRRNGKDGFDSEEVRKESENGQSNGQECKPEHAFRRWLCNPDITSVTETNVEGQESNSNGPMLFNSDFWRESRIEAEEEEDKEAEKDHGRVVDLADDQRVLRAAIVEVWKVLELQARGRGM